MVTEPKALRALMFENVTQGMIEHLTRVSCSVFPDLDFTGLVNLITLIALRSRLRIATLLSSLVYLNRLRFSYNGAWPPGGIGNIMCLVALILSTKYNDDVSLNNKQWVSTILGGSYSIFATEDINRMEIYFIAQLGWGLGITAQNLFSELIPLLDYAFPQKPASSPFDREFIWEGMGYYILCIQDTPGCLVVHAWVRSDYVAGHIWNEENYLATYWDYLEHEMLLEN